MVFLGRSIHEIRNQITITLLHNSVSKLTILLAGHGKQDQNIYCFGVCDWWGAL